ncbi:MerR family transcriptional regulator [Chelativorans composti]|uniref:Helix-turn-helix domain-containing protein n=1 Tax=Chelativorans composti TaxID=768533 RepID=A0ABW5DBN3_9HYPH
MTRPMTIGHLARETGVRVETIRFYEKCGLLPPPARTGGNYRAYEESHLRRLHFIRRARELGFSLDQVRAMLAMSDNKNQSCEAVDAIARVHLEEVERKIADLTELKQELDRMVNHAHGPIADCRIIETLNR